MNILTKTFIKLLGKGRAWLCNDSFTQEFFELLISPAAQLKKHLSELKYVHFPSIVIKEENVINSEIMFNLTNTSKTLETRANNAALEWRMLNGNLHYKTLENALNKAGYKIRIIEFPYSGSINLGNGITFGSYSYNQTQDSNKIQYGAHSGKLIANGILNIEEINKEPVQLVDGKNAFYIQGYFTPSESDWDKITDIVLKLKPAHKVAVCQIAERTIADNYYYNVSAFNDNIDGGTPATTEFFEHLNP